PTVRGETRMVSFNCNSWAIRSSPQVGFSAAISRISLRRSVGIGSLPGAVISSAREDGMPCGANGRVRLDVHQGVTAREQAARNYHNQPSGIIGAVWLSPIGSDAEPIQKPEPRSAAALPIGH